MHKYMRASAVLFIFGVRNTVPGSDEVCKL